MFMGYTFLPLIRQSIFNLEVWKMELCFTVFKLDERVDSVGKSRRAMWKDILEKGGPGLIYCCLQEEVSPKTKNNHLQGYMELDKVFNYNHVKWMYGGEMYVAKRMGSRLQAIHYCRKPGDYCECVVCKKARVKGGYNGGLKGFYKCEYVCPKHGRVLSKGIVFRYVVGEVERELIDRIVNVRKKVVVNDMYLRYCDVRYCSFKKVVVGYRGLYEEGCKEFEIK